MRPPCASLQVFLTMLCSLRFGVFLFFAGMVGAERLLFQSAGVHIIPFTRRVLSALSADLSAELPTA